MKQKDTKKPKVITYQMVSARSKVIPYCMIIIKPISIVFFSYNKTKSFGITILETQNF